jgi:hypothetical protein
MVQGEALDCGPAYARHAFKMEAIRRPPEVARPSLPARIEEWHRALRRRIEARLKSQFLKLAGIATHREVLQRSRPTATFRHDMVHAQAMRKETLWRMTVLAAVAGTPGHPEIKSPQIGFAWLGHSLLRTFG